MFYFFKIGFLALVAVFSASVFASEPERDSCAKLLAGIRLNQPIADSVVRDVNRILAQYLWQQRLDLDVRQDTILRLYQMRDCLPEGTQMKHWVLRVAWNVGREHRRRYARRSKTEVLLGEEDESVAGPEKDEVDYRMTAIENRVRLDRELSLLDARSREALERWSDGVPHQAIAQALGTTEDHSRILVHRALMRIKLNLNPDAIGHDSDTADKSAEQLKP